MDYSQYSLLFLTLGHYLADFPLQGEFLGVYKAENDYLLLSHVIIYSLTLSAILIFLGLFSSWKLILLLSSHYLIDYWKCRIANKKNPEESLKRNLYIDQLLHLLVLFTLL